MPLTTEQRRENMAKARAAKTEKRTVAQSAVLDALTESVERDFHQDGHIAFAGDPLAELRAKVDVLWAAHENRSEQERGYDVLFQCDECGATTKGPHPKFWNGRPDLVECPNRNTLHSGQPTPLDYR